MSSSKPGHGRLPTATVTTPDGRTAGGGRPHRRRLSNYLLDKRLQLRYVGFVTVLSALLSGTLGYLIWQQEHLASSAIMQSVDTLCEGLDGEACADLKAELDQNLSSHDTNLVLLMSGVGVGLIAVLFLLMVIMTHKVAGPLYKISTYFGHMSEGRLGAVYPLRKGDMLLEFYDKFKDMHEAVRGRFRADNELYERFLRTCDDAGVERSGDLGEQLDALEQLRDERERALS
ncbi:hypothetical protein [Haliangium sp.]|uniref:hypothetical protein n=1 Tax=Haliangium sp. TaxID=2663208 RepID=UPI003D0D4491